MLLLFAKAHFTETLINWGVIAVWTVHGLGSVDSFWGHGLEARWVDPTSTWRFVMHKMMQVCRLPAA